MPMKPIFLIEDIAGNNLVFLSDDELLKIAFPEAEEGFTLRLDPARAKGLGAFLLNWGGSLLAGGPELEELEDTPAAPELEGPRAVPELEERPAAPELEPLCKVDWEDGRFSYFACRNDESEPVLSVTAVPGEAGQHPTSFLVSLAPLDGEVLNHVIAVPAEIMSVLVEILRNQGVPSRPGGVGPDGVPIWPKIPPLPGESTLFQLADTLGRVMEEAAGAGAPDPDPMANERREGGSRAPGLEERRGTAGTPFEPPTTVEGVAKFAEILFDTLEGARKKRRAAELEEEEKYRGKPDENLFLLQVDGLGLKQRWISEKEEYQWLLFNSEQQDLHLDYDNELCLLMALCPFATEPPWTQLRIGGLEVAWSAGSEGYNLHILHLGNGNGFDVSARGLNALGRVWADSSGMR